MTENQPKKLTPDQALDLLSQATQPQAIMRLSREDFVNIHIAIQVLRESIQAKNP